MTRVHNTPDEIRTAAEYFRGTRSRDLYLFKIIFITFTVTSLLVVNHSCIIIIHKTFVDCITVLVMSFFFLNTNISSLLDACVLLTFFLFCNGYTYEKSI